MQGVTNQVTNLPVRVVCRTKGCTRWAAEAPPGKKSEFCTLAHAQQWLRRYDSFDLTAEEAAAAGTGTRGEDEREERERVNERGAGGAGGADSRASDDRRRQEEERKNRERRRLPPLSPPAAQSKRPASMIGGPHPEQGASKTPSPGGVRRDSRGRRMWGPEGTPVVANSGNRASSRIQERRVSSDGEGDKGTQQSAEQRQGKAPASVHARAVLSCGEDARTGSPALGDQAVGERAMGAGVGSNEGAVVDEQPGMNSSNGLRSSAAGGAAVEEGEAGASAADPRPRFWRLQQESQNA